MYKLLRMATFIAVLLLVKPANAVNGRISPDARLIEKVPIFVSKDAIDLAHAAFERDSLIDGFAYASCIVNIGIGHMLRLDGS